MSEPITAMEQQIGSGPHVMRLDEYCEGSALAFLYIRFDDGALGIHMEEFDLFDAATADKRVREFEQLIEDCDDGLIADQYRAAIALIARWREAASDE